jgi:hypothetical protein
MGPLGSHSIGPKRGINRQCAAQGRGRSRGACRERKASTSFVQRHLQIGYSRAARLIEKMAAEGLVSPANQFGKREVLAPPGR